jgi:hypothetical protein
MARAVIGLSAWVTPVFASRLLGVDASNDRSVRFYLKLAGTRDLALAAGTLTFAGEAKVQMMRIAAACDLADIAATLITRKQGDVSKAGTPLWIGASLACLAMTVKAQKES